MNAIIYRSLTGHSKKIANAIALELGIKAYNIKNKPVLKGVDLLFIVGGIYSGKSLPDTLEYIKTLTNQMVKKALLITSSVTNKNGQDEIRDILISKGIEVLKEEYQCYGNFLFIKIGHPNKKEIADAVSFVKNVK